MDDLGISVVPGDKARECSSDLWQWFWKRAAGLVHVGQSVLSNHGRKKPDREGSLRLSVSFG